MKHRIKKNKNKYKNSDKIVPFPEFNTHKKIALNANRPKNKMKNTLNCSIICYYSECINSNLFCLILYYKFVFFSVHCCFDAMHKQNCDKDMLLSSSICHLHGVNLKLTCIICARVLLSHFYTVPIHWPSVIIKLNFINLNLIVIACELDQFSCK